MSEQSEHHKIKTDTLYEEQPEMRLSVSDELTDLKLPASVEDIPSSIEISKQALTERVGETHGFSLAILPVVFVILCGVLAKNMTPIPLDHCIGLTIEAALIAVVACMERGKSRNNAFLMLGLASLFYSAFELGEHCDTCTWYPDGTTWDCAMSPIIGTSIAVIPIFLSAAKAIAAIPRYTGSYVRKLFRGETSSDVDCGTPGNSFLMSWIAMPISLFYAVCFACWLPYAIYQCAIGKSSFMEFMAGTFLSTGLCLTLILGRWVGRQYALHRLIEFSSTGLTFDEDYIPSLNGKRVRQWDYLHSVEFAGPLNSKDLLELDKLVGCTLTLSFQPDGFASLDLTRMKRTEVTKLLMQIDANCDRAVFTKQAFTFTQILLGAASADVDADEQLVTDNLEMQFSATHFVPLNTGFDLQNGRYRILTQIASGGMSSVYAAEMSSDTERRNHQTNVVVKESVLPFSMDGKTRDKAKELFAREAKILAKLNHPQIVRILDSFVEHERDYLVLEHKKGPTYGRFAKECKKIKSN